MDNINTKEIFNQVRQDVGFRTTLQKYVDNINDLALVSGPQAAKLVTKQEQSYKHGLVYDYHVITTKADYAQTAANQQMYNMNHQMKIQNIELREEKQKMQCNTKFWEIVNALMYEKYNRELNPSEKSQFSSLFETYMLDIKESVIEILKIKLRITTFVLPKLKPGLCFFLFILGIIPGVLYIVFYNKNHKNNQIILDGYKDDLSKSTADFFQRFGLRV